MKARARAHGAATIIAAFATGRGAALGVDLKKTVEVELLGEGAGVGEAPGELTLPDYCVKRVFGHFKVEYGYRIRELEDAIPRAVGLKSSSTVANATVLAAAEAVSRETGLEKPDDIALVNLGVDAAFDAKVTATGAFDDATASYFGGVTVTDNLNRGLVKRDKVEDLGVLVLVPEGQTLSASVDVRELKKISREIGLAWDKAKDGRVYEALTVNGIMHSLAFGHDPAPAVEALSAGAVAAGLSGTGPATVALCRDRVDEVRDALMAFEGNIIETKTTNERSGVVA